MYAVFTCCQYKECSILLDTVIVVTFRLTPQSCQHGCFSSLHNDTRNTSVPFARSKEKPRINSP